jgi:hypothetical protein
LVLRHYRFWKLAEQFFLFSYLVYILKFSNSISVTNAKPPNVIRYILPPRHTSVH